MATCLKELHQESVVGVKYRKERIRGVALRTKSNNEENITSFVKVIYPAICRIDLNEESVVGVK
jgi:hypothetical protein